MIVNDYQNKVMLEHIIFSIIIFNFINRNESYIVKVDKRRSMNNGMESVFQKYLNSIKKLSADFPNHNLELQFEVVEPAPQPPLLPLRRMFRRYKQPILRRSGDETNMVTHKSNKVTATEHVTTVHTSPTTTTVTTPSLPHTTTTVTTLGLQDKPLYREDLQKALEEFEKKISRIQITTGCKENHPFQTVAFSTYSSTLPTPTYIINKNIENIVELLRRGVHVETHVDKPSNENLDWLQIKIPKNI